MRRGSILLKLGIVAFILRQLFRKTIGNVFDVTSRVHSLLEEHGASFKGLAMYILNTLVSVENNVRIISGPPDICVDCGRAEDVTCSGRSSARLLVGGGAIASYRFHVVVSPATTAAWITGARRKVANFNFHGEGAAVAERLACSPPTKAIRVQSPAGSLTDCRESVWTMPLAGWSSLESPVSSAILTSTTPIDSQDLVADSRPTLHPPPLTCTRTHSRTHDRVIKCPRTRTAAAATKEYFIEQAPQRRIWLPHVTAGARLPGRPEKIVAVFAVASDFECGPAFHGLDAFKRGEGEKKNMVECSI
ncbi:hypothetical protein PR048_004029 [Dryococelus australis]|uniref:Uncharacterized protein n=1 Tax=Dryococelus australis TaxID=614101 RepID=A0ABQ9I559_9NEOP|nr:hypothetical protein PR048_004029 [Dryococelus australis]